MHLKPDELIWGVAPHILIDCASRIHARQGKPFTMDFFCRAIGAPLEEAAPVLEQMISEGLFTPQGDVEVLYKPTAKLGQLALANISHGLQRAEAIELLAQVVNKARLINSNPEKFFCEVVCLVVFGSYLTPKCVLGDLDIGVELREIRDPNRPRGRMAVRLILSGASPSAKVRAALRLRKPRQISIHMLDEVLGLGTPYQLVYGELPDPLPQREPNLED